MAVLDLHSEVSGVVWRVVASPGDVLAEDDTVLLIESMKMEVPVAAPEDCRLLEVTVQPEQMVKEGELVARLEIGQS